MVAFALGEGLLGRTLLWGVDAGINAALAVGIPYVLTFYLILSILEDSGYLNSIAFLTDPFMHKIGLHGRAMIPMVAGAGCNVPGIMGTRVSARCESASSPARSCHDAVQRPHGGHRGRRVLVRRLEGGAPRLSHLGAVGFGAGWGHRALPGRSIGLVMEMFPFRAP